MSRTHQQANTMTGSDLLQLVIEAHGGRDRWNSISRFRAEASITGAIWSMKGQGASWTRSFLRARRGISASRSAHSPRVIGT
jgi:hypothetical protein